MLQTSPDSQTPIISYHGKTQPADISSLNAVAITRLVLQSPESNIMATKEKNSPLTVSSLTYSAQSTPTILTSLFQQHSADLLLSSPLATGTVQSYATTQYGEQGGSVYMVSEQDPTSQRTTSIMVYDHFQSQGQHLHGRIRMTTSTAVSPYIEIIYTFEHLYIQQAKQQVILSGNQSIRTHIPSLSTSIVANYLVENVSTGHQALSDNFTTLLQQNGDITLSGVLYDSDFGKLDIQTTSSLNISATSALPYAGGPLQIFGLAGQSIRISPTHDAEALVEVDTNGDLIFDYSAGLVALGNTITN